MEDNKQKPDNAWQLYVLAAHFLLAGLLAAMVFFVTGCSCPAHLPSDQTSSVTRDSIVVRDSLIIRDSLVLVPMPVESSQNVLPEYMPSHLESSVATSDAWVDSTGLHHTLANKQASLPAHVPVTEHYTSTETQHSQETITTHTEYVEEEKPLTWWESFKIGAFWYLCAAVLLLLLWTFRKFILKLFI